MECLPPELWAQIFDFFTYSQLLPLLDVCTHWRTLAETRPAFWSDIDLFRCGRSAVHLWKRRILATNGRPFKLVLRPHIDTDLECDILPHVAEHLHHMETLVIYLPRLQYLDLVRLFQRLSAPLLRSLVVSVFHDPKVALPVLPVDLFGGNPCPLLNLVHLENIDLSHDTTIPAFSNVRCLHFGSCLATSRLHGAPDLFSHFPSMRTLGMYGNTISLLDVFKDAASFAALTHLELAADAKHHALQHWPLHAVRHAVYHGWTKPSDVRMALQRSPWDNASPLHIVLEPFHTALDARLGNADWTWSCSFRETRTSLYKDPLTAPNAEPDWGTSSAPSDVFSDAVGFARTLASLTLPISLWRIATRFLHDIEALTELRLIVNMPSLHKAEGDFRKVHCPNLGTLLLRSVPDSKRHVRVVSQELTQFAMAELKGVQFPVQLCLEAVVLDVERDAAFDLCFSPVQHSAASIWSYASVRKALARDYLPISI